MNIYIMKKEDYKSYQDTAGRPMLETENGRRTTL